MTKKAEVSSFFSRPTLLHDQWLQDYKCPRAMLSISSALAYNMLRHQEVEKAKKCKVLSVARPAVLKFSAVRLLCWSELPRTASSN